MAEANNVDKKVNGAVELKALGHGPTIGRNYLILTRGYHWTGRLVEVTALEYVLDDACMFVDIGQLDRAVVGQWSSESRGRPIPSGQTVGITRPGSERIDYVGKLPRKPIG